MSNPPATSTPTTLGNNPIFSLILGIIMLTLGLLTNNSASVPSFLPNVLGAGFLASIYNIFAYFTNAPATEDYNYDKAIQTFLVGGFTGLVATGGAFAGINPSVLTPVGSLATVGLIILLEYIIKGFKQGNFKV